MNRKLSTKERNRLMSSHRKERDGRVRDRIKAVLAYDDEYTYSEISRILLLDDETIRRHINDYFSIHKLAPENGGSDSYLSKSASKALKQHLQKTTYRYVKNICAYVRKTFRCSYSISGMTKWLHANGFRYKKPHGVPAKADQEQQADFIKMYQELKRKVGNKEPIYFGDSVHPEHQTRLACGWILKGERKPIAMTARQRRLNFIGGICLSGHKVVCEEAEKVNSENIASFLKSLRKKHPDKKKIHLILDTASYHRSKEVRAAAKSIRIELHYLPPYSPNLNPIERLWKIFHEQVTYNQYYEKFFEFREAAHHFFRHIGKKKKILRSRITDNFHVIDVPKLAS